MHLSSPVLFHLFLGNSVRLRHAAASDDWNSCWSRRALRPSGFSRPRSGPGACGPIVVPPSPRCVLADPDDPWSFSLFFLAAAASPALGCRVIGDERRIKATTKPFVPVGIVN